MPRTFTKEELNAIDELAMQFAEGSDDLMGLSYALQAVIRNKLLSMELKREREQGIKVSGRAGMP